MSERISHHAKECVTVFEKHRVLGIGPCVGADGKTRERRVAKADQRRVVLGKLAKRMAEGDEDEVINPYRERRQGQRRGSSKGPHVPANSIPQYAAPVSSVESAAPTSKQDQIAIRAIEFMDSDEYQGDSDFAVDSACQFAAAFAERELARVAASSPVPKLVTRFAEFDDADHPANQWWQKHGHFMMSGGGRKEFIWACRGWIAREQLMCGVEVTGESTDETAPEPKPDAVPKLVEALQNLSLSAIAAKLYLPEKSSVRDDLALGIAEAAQALSDYDSHSLARNEKGKA